ncbi:MAG: hypothetical protein V1696_00730 [Candidatus Jorgensenbacteria bacterium]
MMGRSDKTNRKRKGITPPVSDYPSRAAWEAACWKKLAASQGLLRLLITAYERHDLVMRAAALDRILSGKSYRQIGEELWLSPQTVSGIKKAFKEKNYRSYLERSKTERKKRIYHSLRHPAQARPHGRPVRTKYGIVYIP